MRIINGLIKGYKFKTPKISDLRVTPLIARKEIFDFIGRKIKHAVVLDLFAGSGSLGLESLSCGALKSVFVDLHEDSILNIQESLKAHSYLMGRGLVYRENAGNYIERANPYEFDIVFFTPPYKNLHLYLIPKLKRIIKPGGILVLEFPPSFSIDRNSIYFRGYTIEKTANYGWSRIVFLKHY